MRSILYLISIVGLGVLLLSSAYADAIRDTPDPDRMQGDCLPFRSLIGPANDDSLAAWNQVLSFAACVQDASIPIIDDVDQLPALVERLENDLAPALVLYAAAMQHGPGPVQLRAGFQIAMSQIALITRARASLVVPTDRATNPKAAAHYRELQQRLEPLLEGPARLAWMLFVVIVRVAAEDPSVATDDVTRSMVRAAHELALSVRWAVPLPVEPATTTGPLMAGPR